MDDDARGMQLLERLINGHPVEPIEIEVLAEPWREFARAVAHVDVAARPDALTSIFIDHPDVAAVAARVLKWQENGTGARPSRSMDPAVLVRLERVDASPVRWLWPGRLPLGKLTILDGDPGLGKSALTLDLAARVSAHRPMPDDTVSDLTGPRGVVLLSAEDGLADTIRPRLEAAGAELSRIAALALVVETPSSRRYDVSHPSAPRLPTLADFEAIRRAVSAVGAALVVVDPIMAYLPRGVDSGKDADVRSILSRLAGIAESEGVAILAVRHLNKSGGGNPLYRGGGSIGIIGAARSGLLVGKDPSDESGVRRVLASTKANLAVTSASLAYHLEAAENGSLQVVWEGPTSETASSLLEAARERELDRPTAVGDARDLLRDMLAEGPTPATAILTEARNAGISERTLRRAARLLSIRARKDGRGPWIWELPNTTPQENPKAAKRPTSGNVGSLL